MPRFSAVPPLSRWTVLESKSSPALCSGSRHSGPQSASSRDFSLFYPVSPVSPLYCASPSAYEHAVISSSGKVLRHLWTPLSSPEPLHVSLPLYSKTPIKVVSVSPSSFSAPALFNPSRVRSHLHHSRGTAVPKDTQSPLRAHLTWPNSGI